MDADRSEPARREGVAWLRRRAREDRERPVVEGHDLADTEELDRQRCPGRVHRVVATDRDHREIRSMQILDPPHVRVPAGIAGVIDAISVLELDDEARRITEVERRLPTGVPVTGG